MSEQNVCFICSRCNHVIKLDPSFDFAETETLEELASSSQTLSNSEIQEQTSFTRTDEENEISESSSSDDNPPQEHEIVSSGSEKRDSHTESVHSIYDQNVSDVKPCQESINSFTFIGETNGASMETLSHKMKVAVRMFDIISGNSDMDHPLCEECADSLMEQLKKESDRCLEERELYEKCLDNLAKIPSDEPTLELLTEKLEKLKAEEQDLLDQLEATEKEREAVQKEFAEIDRQREQLRREEETHLQEYCELRFQQLELEEDQCSAEKQLQHVEHLLKKLSKTNVFNATFHIWHQGNFGTINGFRLGRLPGNHVEWTEINAAWGQVVLLLSSLAKKMGLNFKRYRLVPFGNHSYIESLDDKSKELPLYGSGGLRFLWDTKFDQAMVAFLDCLQQFKEEVERSNGFSLPYRMDKGKIEDTGGTNASYSIKMQFNSEEQWTKALKFMLTNLKWGLAWVSTQFTPA